MTQRERDAESPRGPGFGMRAHRLDRFPQITGKCSQDRCVKINVH